MHVPRRNLRRCWRRTWNRNKGNTMPIKNAENRTFKCIFAWKSCLKSNKIFKKYLTIVVLSFTRGFLIASNHKNSKKKNSYQVVQFLDPIDACVAVVCAHYTADSVGVKWQKSRWQRNLARWSHWPCYRWEGSVRDLQHSAHQVELKTTWWKAMHWFYCNYKRKTVNQRMTGPP